MRKEVLFAILAGIALGLILAFGVWRANLALRTKNAPQSSQKENTSATEPAVGMTLATPENFDVVSERSLLIVSGITKPNLLVAISLPQEDFVVRSGQEGEFSQEVPLIEGVNEILVTSFDIDGSTIEKRLFVAYSTEFAKQATPLPSPTVTSSEVSTASNEVREKVQEKIDQAKRNPKFVMGSVTDKQATTIEIRDFNGEIRQISLNPDEAAFVKIAKTRTQVKFADVAIGDFIVAMGFANGNGVLEAIRILITEEFELSGREAKLGSIDDLKKAEFTLRSDKTSDKFLIKDSKDLILFSGIGEEQEEISFSELEEEQAVVVLGTKEDTIFTARTIVVVD